MASNWPRRCDGDMRFQPWRARGSREKRQLESGREIALGFHGGEKQFGNLFGPASTGLGAFWLVDQIGEPLADGVAQRVEPSPKGFILGEEAFQFNGHNKDALFGVGFEKEFGRCAFGDVAARLHFLVYEQKVLALASGKE